VTPLLGRFGVERFVTGHTPQPGRIAPRFGNRIILIDTGMLSSFYKNGRASALELQNGGITAIYGDSRTAIVPPAAAYLPDPLPFFRARPGAAARFDAAARAISASAASRY
jgi:hypothetical protein